MKLQSIFVSYLLLPVISIILGIGTIALNKINQLISNKDLIAFSILTSVALSLPGLLTLTGIDFIDYYYNTMQIVYLFIGFYYSKKINLFFSTQNQLHNISMIILTTALNLCVGSYLFSLLFNFLGNLQYGILASTCTFTITLPIFINWSYQSMRNIPTEIFDTWKYQTTNTAYNFSSDTIEKIIVVDIEISKQRNDKEFSKIKAKAPLNFIFGDWFQLFIHDHNIKYADNAIEYISSDGEAYEWIFYEKPKLLSNKKHIDFKKTIAENQFLKNNSIIVCKRTHYIQ